MLRAVQGPGAEASGGSRVQEGEASGTRARRRVPAHLAYRVLAEAEEGAGGTRGVEPDAGDVRAGAGAHPGEPVTTQALRAVANALWPALRWNRWRWHVQSRDLADRGDRPPFRSVSTGSIPNAPRALDRFIIARHQYVRCAVWAEEWHGGLNLVVELTDEQYLRALVACDWPSSRLFQNALEGARARKPFEQTRNRHGSTVLRRNSADPGITPHLAATLEAIAGAASVRVVEQHDVDDALLADEDISPAAVYYKVCGDA